MPAAETSLASTVFAHIPESDRSKFCRSLINSLQVDDQPSIDFVASLTRHYSDQETEQDFLSFLEQTIVNGTVDCAVPVSLRYSSLGSSLLSRAMDFVSKAKSKREDGQHHDAAVLSYLRFSKSTAPHLPAGQAHSRLLQSSIDHLSASNDDIGTVSRDVLFTMLSAPDEEFVERIVLAQQYHIWRSIQKLVESKQKRSQILLGYSLWLRWILSARGCLLRIDVPDSYWQLILQGLRFGDSEQRKTCLMILKLTMVTEASTIPQATREQYDRYCTVFETIVLGRYMNQIQDCEGDLDFLATSSDVEPQWLLALLASALDSRMQESNRKFVGNWVLRSGLKPTPDFLYFFRDDFLPWAIQGQLFVSTLRRRRGEMRCIHGDRLALFVRRLLQDNSHPEHLMDIIFDTISQKRKPMFPYATVYLLEGLEENMPQNRMDKLSELPSMPEVARDYVSRKSCNNVAPNKESAPPSRREVKEQDAIAKCTASDPDIDSLDDIWSDLEYLEFPKRLVMLIPKTIFQPRLLQRATQDPAMATNLAEKVRTLQAIAETKTFLFAPLVLAVRSILAANPSAFKALDIENFILRAAEHPPEPTIDLMLEEATIHLTALSYESYFGERISYGFAALLDLVSRLGGHQDLVGRILDRIVQRWRGQKIPPLTVSSWKTTLQLQVLLLCCEQRRFSSAYAVQALVDDLLHVLAIEPLPRYRCLLEWTTVRMIMTYDLKDVLLARLRTKDHHSNPKHLASLMKIGSILACTPDSGADFALQLATTFVPLAASSKVVIRHEAQWQIPALMDHARSKGWVSIIGNPAFVALDDYIRSLERFHDPPPERRNGMFDPIGDHTMANLVEGPWFDLDHTEAPLTSRNEFVRLYHAGLPGNAPRSCVPLGEEINRPLATTQETDGLDLPDSNETVGPRTAHDVAALQTKGTAYLARTLSDPSSHQDRPSDLIVVGSLVDNPYNLGGLSRVAEIFGASALCLQNQNVLSNKDFTSVSVSSHLHFPIIQLSASGVPAFLAERKAEGFAVVGIEQTHRSVLLGSEECKIPEKVVLVVGSEKEGIAAIVLTECDMLVEIPQKGITRSLNVQTAVSIVLYEHARQYQRALQWNS